MRQASFEQVAVLKERVRGLRDTTMEQVAVSIGLDPSSLSRQLNKIRPMPQHVAAELATRLDRLERAEKAAREASARVLAEEAE